LRGDDDTTPIANGKSALLTDAKPRGEKESREVCRYLHLLAGEGRRFHDHERLTNCAAASHPPSAPSSPRREGKQKGGSIAAPFLLAMFQTGVGFYEENTTTECKIPFPTKC
jgi:hypothetical protein